MTQPISIDTRNTRIAFVTDDGTSISPHFGRARFYEVVTISNGAVVERERREKPGHHTFHTGEEHAGGHSSSGPEQTVKHNAMVGPIVDCAFLVARGMGTGAHEHLSAARITPVITGCKTIADALTKIADGTLDDHPERLH